MVLSLPKWLASKRSVGKRKKKLDLPTRRGLDHGISSLYDKAYTINIYCKLSFSN